MHVRNIIATTTLALLAGALLIHPAAAAATHSPGPTIERPSPDMGRTAEPGDPFFPATTNAPTSQPPKTYAPWEATCVYGGKAEAGKFWIGFKNTGTTTIPKGTVLLIDTPYGTYKVKTIDELEPGETYSFAYFDKNPGPIDCEIDFSPSPADYPPEGPR
jgi:hypothetical protein